MRIIVLIYYSTYIVLILPIIIGPCMHPLFENKNSYMHACMQYGVLPPFNQDVHVQLYLHHSQRSQLLGFHFKVFL